MDYKQPQIKCIQFNLQHSKAAKANLMNITEKDKTDIISIQEPYIFQCKAAGIRKIYKTYTSKEGRCRAAVVATKNNQIDTILIQQLSDADTVVVVIIKGSLN